MERKGGALGGCGGGLSVAALAAQARDTFVDSEQRDLALEGLPHGPFQSEIVKFLFPTKDFA